MSQLCLLKSKFYVNSEFIVKFNENLGHDSNLRNIFNVL